MALDLAQKRNIGIGHVDPHRGVKHKTPRHYPTPSDSQDVQHPAPILNTNVNPVSEIFSYTGDHTKFVLVLVGLPARGKSFIARKIRSYLSWLGIDVQWFNIGQYRRYCAKDTVGVQSSEFFDPRNQVAKKRRELYALIALAELEKYLVFNKGQVAILDGTNTTEYRRRMIRSFFVRKNRPSPNLKIKIVFIESICNDERIIERNILNVKLRSPDYVNVLPEKAVADFKERIKHYENMYVPLTEEDGSYIKLIDAGKKVIGHEVNGYLPSRILYYLMHLNMHKVAHFFTRHGESLYNTLKRIGGDSPLTESGIQYSKTMADFMSLQPEFKGGQMQIWCSTLKRCTQTAKPFLRNVMRWRALCEIEAGICDGMTYEQIELEFPDEFIERAKQKLTYRYPQGESYKDVIKRLEPVIFELERTTKPVLVIAHQAVLRCLYGYFMDKPLEDIPYLRIDLHTVYKLSPTDYSTIVDKFTFGCDKSKYTKSEDYRQDMDLRPARKNKSIASLSSTYLPHAMKPRYLHVNFDTQNGTKPTKKATKTSTNSTNNLMSQIKDKGQNGHEENNSETENYTLSTFDDFLRTKYDVSNGKNVPNKSAFNVLDKHQSV
eukprot:220461_1